MCILMNRWNYISMGISAQTSTEQGHMSSIYQMDKQEDWNIQTDGF